MSDTIRPRPIRSTWLVLLCAAAAASSAAAGTHVAVTPATHAYAVTTGAQKKATAKPRAAEAVPSPVQYRLSGRLDAHGHVQAECTEVENPKLRAARRRNALAGEAK